MIRIGRTATIAGDERVATVAEAFNEQIGSLANLGRVRCKLRAALQQFGKMVAAGWCGVHAEDTSSRETPQAFNVFCMAERPIAVACSFSRLFVFLNSLGGFRPEHVITKKGSDWFSQGKLGCEEIARFPSLPLEDWHQLLPCGPESVRGRREIVLDRLPQAGEVVERHRWEHMVLHMILHVPVKKGWEPTAGEGAAAEPEIRHIRRHPGMLGRAAEQSEPGAIMATKGHDQDQDPVAGGNKEDRQEKMADQQRAGPVAMLATEFEVFLRQDFCRPFRSEC